VEVNRIIAEIDSQISKFATGARRAVGRHDYIRRTRAGAAPKGSKNGASTVSRERHLVNAS